MWPHTDELTAQATLEQDLLIVLKHMVKMVMWIGFLFKNPKKIEDTSPSNEKPWQFLKNSENGRSLDVDVLATAPNSQG